VRSLEQDWSFRQYIDVRCGPDARAEFIVPNDRTIRVAVEQFPRLRELLAALDTKQIGR
jgi:hypothetical protein